jgi:hypothetical protein
MLAICSDLDETPNKNVYFETARYLNTREQTLLGKGIGLEVGNSIYFDMPVEQFSYLNTDKQGREIVHKLIESGHIDCLHSFGDHVDNRLDITTYWQLISRGKRKIEVWVDHAQAPTNLDNGIMKGSGAIKNSATYHSDITCQPTGIAFIWKGRVTSVIAQNSKYSLSGIFSNLGIKKSLKTLLVEFSKHLLGHLGSVKYKMHKSNQLLRKTKLLDGTDTYEFMRSNPSYSGVSTFESTRGLHQVLNKRMLDTLIKRQGATILYTHLGKIFSVDHPFSDKTRSAFELLADYYQQKKILVLTTRRLLGYLRSKEQLSFQIKKKNGKTIIDMQTCYQGEDLGGLTWYVRDPQKTYLYINGIRFLNLQINATDESGQASVSIPWIALNFPSYEMSA